MDSKKLNLDMRKYGMFILLIVIFLLFYFLSGGRNASAMNINNLIMQNSYVVILAIGMLLCVLTGNVDLGVGSVVALTGAISAILVVDNGMSTPVAFIVALLIGLGCGMFAGFFIAFMGVPPFIVTLATMLMGRGLTYVALKAQTKGPLPKSFTEVGAGYLPTIPIKGLGGAIDLITVILALIASVLLILTEVKTIRTKKKYDFKINPRWQIISKNVIFLALLWFFALKLASYRGVPIVLVLMLVLIGIYHFITTKTVSGRYIYALGGNEKAARLSGIDTRKVFFFVYTNMGVLSAVAGIVLAARNASATPKAGDGFELDAIASCYIGGAATAGGSGTIIGAVIGAFIMGILNNGMSLIGWSTDIQRVVKGGVLLAAVTVDLMSKRRKK